MAGENSIFSLETAALGRLVSMTLSHDGSGPHPDWRVVSVQVRNVLTDEKTYFHVNRLLTSAWSENGSGECVTVDASDSAEPPSITPLRRSKKDTDVHIPLKTPTIPAKNGKVGADTPEVESSNSTPLADAAVMRSPIGDTDSIGSNDVFDHSIKSTKVTTPVAEARILALTEAPTPTPS